MKPKIVITVKGGLITDITSNSPINISIIDYDVDSDINTIPISRNNEEYQAEAHCRIEPVTIHPSEANRLYKFIYDNT